MNMLSQAALAVWAKSEVRRGEWLPLHQHLRDSGAVMDYLVQHWLAPSLRKTWAAHFPEHERDLRQFLKFVAASHDCGKASTAFAVQVESLAEVMRTAGLPAPSLDQLRPLRKDLPHALAGQAIFQRWFTERHGNAELRDQIGSIIGAHHGRTTTDDEVNKAPRRSDLLGDAAWVAVQDEFLDWLDRETGCVQRWVDWAEVSLPRQVLVAMSGLVIVADWIASSTSYFPLRDIGSDAALLSDSDFSERSDTALYELMMPPVWAPSVPSVSEAAIYQERFGWTDDRVPRSIQILGEAVARSAKPGLIIIEAGMGEGKTELALVMAEILGARWGAGGLFFALPTQATTDAMLTRVAPWIDRLPGLGRDDNPWAIGLQHGKARFNEDFLSMMVDLDATPPASADIDDDPMLAAFIAHIWFASRKRALLATFGIGTIDQVLLAALPQRHLMLRHLALAGKVVVLDEVHAADEYMRVYLTRALQWLAAYGVPVIMLSATLPPAVRQQLLNAYANPYVRLTGGHRDPVEVQLTGPAGYPMITTLGVGEIEATTHTCPSAPDRPDLSVEFQTIHDDDSQILDILRSELDDGGCAVVVRNTVRAAQRTASVLRDAGIAEVSLCHARFTVADRRDNDRRLLERFGPAGPDADSTSSRPTRHIVVATQVVEQSLDIDFDLMVTDVPPADLLCQRLGRLHRHAATARPSRLAKPRCYLLMADPTVEPPVVDSGSTAVYGESRPLRTLAALEDRANTLRLPADIPTFVADAYSSDPPGPPAWRGALDAADGQQTAADQKQADRASAFALEQPARSETLVNWLNVTYEAEDGASQQAARASVRDGDSGLEVIAVPLSVEGDRVLGWPWADEPGALDVRTPLGDEQARLVGSWAVRLPPELGAHRADDVLKELGDNKALRTWVWRSRPHPWLRGELFLPFRQVAEDEHRFEAVLCGLRLSYSSQRGLEVLKDE